MDVQYCLNLLSIRFRDAHSFNQPLHTWDTSRVTDMSAMFRYASEFEGGNSLSEWNVSNVKDFSSMFQDASSLNVPGIGSWNVSSALSMQSMFDGAAIFNQPMETWDIRQVTSLKQMFRVSSMQEQSVWNIIPDWRDAILDHSSNILSPHCTMQNTHAFNQDLSPWEIHQVVDFSGMFHSATAFRQDLCWSSLNDTQLGQIMEGTHGKLKLMMDSRCLPDQESENQPYIHFLWIGGSFLMFCWLLLAYQLLHWLYCSPCPAVKVNRRSVRRSRRFNQFVEDEEEVMFGDHEATNASNYTDENHQDDDEVMFEDEDQVAENGMNLLSEAPCKSQLFPLHELTFSDDDEVVSPEMLCLEHNVSDLSAIVVGRELCRNDLGMFMA
jgi:surface protein